VAARRPKKTLVCGGVRQLRGVSRLRLLLIRSLVWVWVGGAAISAPAAFSSISIFGDSAPA
jgi:hypothetical protein